jgi:hypothetical protein
LHDLRKIPKGRYNPFYLIVADRESGNDSICIHEERGGTRFGTILYLSEESWMSDFFFADGPPCTTDYKDYSSLLHSY